MYEMMASSKTAGSLVVTCQQTRFNLKANNESREIDVKGLGIIIVTEDNSSVLASNKKRGKSKDQGIEILSNADLRFKVGIHYALVGRNGTGKSTLLRALGNNLIPGMPWNVRIAFLQQTSITGESETIDNAGQSSTKTVLEQVIEGDRFRNEILGDYTTISKALESKEDPVAVVRVSRAISHNRLMKHFHEVEKLASLRSGARGFDARKELIVYEKKVAESQVLLDQEASEIMYETAEHEIRVATDLYNELQTQLESMKIEDIEVKARKVLTGLGFKESQLKKRYSDLSGGWQVRCLLAAALTQPSDLLILDEPTNYLDLLGILWLQRYLASLEETAPDTTVLLVSHDRDFVNAVCAETVILREKTLTYFNGDLAAYEKSIHHSILRMTRMKEAQDRQISHMEKTIANNIRQGKKSGDDSRLRQAKSRQKKVDERMGVNVNATGGRFKLNRDNPGFHNTTRDAIEIPKEEREVTMHFPEAPDLRFPGSLLSLEKVSYSYAKSSSPTLQDVNIVIHAGDKIGIVGLNGAGKSTLIHLLTGKSEPSKGTITRHPRLRIGHYSQHAIEALQSLGQSDLSLTALSYILSQAIELSEDLQEPAARGFLGSLGLSGRTASDVPLAKLSGGQLVRVALARVLLGRPHLLVMDEPTTHLDLPTVTALTRAVAGYEGAVVLVSHDRYLIRCVVEGEPIDPEDSDDDELAENERSNLEESSASKSRRLIYEVKGGKVIERKGGMTGWESSLLGRLKKLGA